MASYRLRLASYSSTIGIAVAALIAIMTGVAAATGARVLVTQQINENNLVTLRGNTRPEFSAQTDRGAVPDSFPLNHLWLLLQRPGEREQALAQFLGQQQDPSSPNFHHWLSAQQFGAQFGPAQQDVDTIAAWLRAHGFTVNLVYPSLMVIDFSGTAAQLQQAFHTQVHYLAVGGQQHIANGSDPQVPAALAPALAGIVSLNDFWPQPMLRQRAGYTIGNGSFAVVPADLATIYSLNPLFTAGLSGQGQSVVVVEDSDLYTTNDWSTFRTTFGLDSAFPAGSLTVIHPQPGTGGANCTTPGTGPDAIEATLDVQWSSAAAPNAAIILASCADNSSITNPGVFVALQNLLNNGGPIPAIVSVSYGLSETVSGASYNAYIEGVYRQAAAEGTSVYVSAGDGGSADTDSSLSNTIAKNGISVSSFASTPYNVAVGGTDFQDTYFRQNSSYWSSTNGPTFGSALSYVPEIPWNNSCASQLLAQYWSGSDIPYGTGGFCNNLSSSLTKLLNIVGGGGGPSACATGSATTPYQISGTCAGYAKPSWQSVLGNPPDGARDLPDISMFAANGIWNHYYVICYSNTADPMYPGKACTGPPSTWSGGGGTSFGAPIMAGIQALIDQKAGGPQGNPNPRLYELANQEYGVTGSAACNASLGNKVAGNCIFNDITEGDNDVVCSGGPDCYLPSGTYGVLSTSTTAYQPAFNSTVGWDFASGIGSPNAYNLVMAFGGGPTATPTSMPTAPPSPSPTAGATPTATAFPTPQPGVAAGTINAPAAISVSGSAGQTVNAGSFSYTNTTANTQQLGAVTVTVSAPAGLAALTLTVNGGQSVTVSPVATSNNFSFNPGLTIAGGTAVSFTMTAQIASTLASAPRAAIHAALCPSGGRFGPLSAGFMLLGLLLVPARPRRRSTMMLALIAVAIVAGAAGCSSSGSSSATAPSLSATVSGSGQLSAPVTLSTITATLGTTPASSVQQLSAVEFL